MAYVDDCIADFRQRKRSLTCDEISVALGDLGFTVINSPRKKGHHIATNPKLKGFHAIGFNCDHGKNGQVKLPYVLDIVRMLETYRDDLA